MEEATHSKRVQCRFESYTGYQVNSETWVQILLATAIV